MCNTPEFDYTKGITRDDADSGSRRGFPEPKGVGMNGTTHARNDVIAAVVWRRGDLRGWLEDHGLPATEGNVDAMAATLGDALHDLCIQRVRWE